MSPKDFLEFGPFRIDRDERVLRQGDCVVALPPKAVETLLVLAGSDGRVVEKTELLSTVWPDTFVEEGGLARNISLLRKALGDDGNTYIETVPRRGYRFIAPVRQRTQSAPATDLNLAVLPLVSLSPDPADEYFADGMTDALISCFMRIEALRVSSLTAVLRYKNTAKTLREIGQELQVGLVAEGSVLLAGGRVRIAVRLIDVPDGKHRWSGAFEKDLRDVLSLQNEVARDVAREIRIQLSPPETQTLTRARQVQPEAYQNYLRGRFFWNQRTKTGLRKALEYFQRAIDEDASYAPAHAGLADAYALLCSTGYDVMPPREAMPLARESATKALELDPTLAEAHAALGFVKLVYDWDWNGAEHHLQRAITLDPHYAVPHQWMGELLMARDQAEVATGAFQQAVELDPLSVPSNLGLGWAYYFARQFPQAQSQFERTLELAPHTPMALYGLGLTLYHLERLAEGMAVFQGADLSTRGEPAAIMLLAVTSALFGSRTDCDQHLQRLREMQAHSYVPAVYFAFIHATRNELDDAFLWLDRAYQERSSYLIFLRHQPVLHLLRADPRFVALLQRIGL